MAYTDTKINVPLAGTNEAVLASVVFNYTSTQVNPFIPPSSLLYYETGKHTGITGSADLVVAGAGWVPSEWEGIKVRNATNYTAQNPSSSNPDADYIQVAEGIVTSNTEGTIVAPLSGGALTTWTNGDKYELVADIDLGDSIFYSTKTNLNGTVQLTSKGTVQIEGINGVHTFSWYIYDVSEDSNSATYTCTVNVTEVV